MQQSYSPKVLKIISEDAIHRVKDNPATFTGLYTLIKNILGISTFEIYYQDEEGDDIFIDCDLSLEEAYENSGNLLKIIVKKQQKKQPTQPIIGISSIFELKQENIQNEEQQSQNFTSQIEKLKIEEKIQEMNLKEDVQENSLKFFDQQGYAEQIFDYDKPEEAQKAIDLAFQEFQIHSQSIESSKSQQFIDQNQIKAKQQENLHKLDDIEKQKKELQKTIKQEQQINKKQQKEIKKQLKQESNEEKSQINIQESEYLQQQLKTEHTQNLSEQSIEQTTPPSNSENFQNPSQKQTFNFPFNFTIPGFPQHLIETISQNLYTLNEQIIKPQFDNIAQIIQNKINNEGNEQQQTNQISNVIHSNIICGECGAYPIIGIRYKCAVCANLDLCMKCEENTSHTHAFFKFKNLEQVIEIGSISKFQKQIQPQPSLVQQSEQDQSEFVHSDFIECASVQENFQVQEKQVKKLNISIPKLDLDKVKKNSQEDKQQYKDQLNQIMDMGFSQNQTIIQQLLQACYGDVDRVISYLIEQENFS